MEFETRSDVTVNEYVEMIRLKTSVLLAAALKIGAYLANSPEEDANQLYEFGQKMGLAFQLQDDYLDVYGDPKVFGKNIGGDILCNKKTYMLITALSQANEKQRVELNKWLTMYEYIPEEKIAAVTRIYDELEIGDQCQRMIDTYYAQGLEILNDLSLPNEKKETLKAFVCSLMNRKV